MLALRSDPSLGEYYFNCQVMDYSQCDSRRIRRFDRGYLDHPMLRTTCVLGSLRAGGVVLRLLSALPQLIWLSEHKARAFGVAPGFLAVSDGLLGHEPS